MGEIIKLNEKHVKAIQNNFIKNVCDNRQKGYARKEAFEKARYEMNIFLINYMFKNPKEISIIQTAYDEIIQEFDQLIRAANLQFDLSMCDEQTKAKYMQLATL